MPRSDRELMVAVQEGDADAFRALYDRYDRALTGFFYRMCYDHAAAEDLKQDTFLKIFRARARYRPEATFRTFLYTVARNLWIDRYRSRKAAPQTVSTDARVARDGSTVGELIPDAGKGTLDRITTREAAAMVRQATGSLPEDQRLVFVLVQDQGLKYREAAEVLDIPVGTVKSRMNAAVTHLRGLLERVLS